MNIFVLDTDPAICAQYHNDKHVVKMILESAQMLTTCWPYPNVSLPSAFQPYRLHKRYFKHPCVFWVDEGDTNYRWLGALFKHLLKEYTIRYKRSHSLEWMEKFFPSVIKEQPINFPLAMPDEWKPWYFATRATPSAAVQAYRKYYYFDKRHLAQWSVRGKPSWYRADHLTVDSVCETIQDRSMD